MDDKLIETNTAKMETIYGVFTATVFSFKNSEEIALVKGGGGIPLVRVQSACLPSTALNSTMCDCNQQIIKAQERLSHESFGILIYLISQEAIGQFLFDFSLVVVGASFL